MNRILNYGLVLPIRKLQSEYRTTALVARWRLTARACQLNAGASADADIFLPRPYGCRSFSNRRRCRLSQVRHLAFSTWSSAKLAQYLAAAGIAVVSRE